MNDTPVIKGYCPGALTPMQSGDGIVVRVRPFNGRLRRAQADGIATLAAAHGNGMLDLSTEALALAQWFLDTRADHKRMAAVLADNTARPPGHIVPRQTQTYTPAPGYTPIGAMVGLAFGQLRVETLAALAKHGGLRMTPWRMLLVESARRLPDIDGLITDPEDPLLRIIACTGALGCAQGHIATRALAADLAAHVPSGQTLHVSGCTKGCAHPRAADLCITGTPDGLNLIRDGRASDTTIQTGLTPQDIIKAL